MTPLELADLRLGAGAEWSTSLPSGHTAAVVVLDGRATVNGSAPLADAEMALLDLEGELLTVRAERETTALLLGGQPLGEPVVQHGPFVMNTGAEIHQAIQDFQLGRMGRLDRG